MDSTISNAAGASVRAEILALVPQQKPFRFIDEILELTPDGVRGTYRFREDESFYAGHFPGNPVTPGVILTECMAQIGLVPLALYLARLESGDAGGEHVTLFTEAEVEFSALVRPGDLVTVESKRQYFRRGKLKCDVELHLSNGDLAAAGVLAGIGVPK